LVASSIAAKKLAAAIPAQSPIVINQQRSSPSAPAAALDGREPQ
jgi:hypothetical protein